MHDPGAAAEALDVRPGLVLACGLALAALWALHPWLFRTEVLATWEGAGALAPLYAFWQPRLRPQALAFAAAGLLLVARAPACCDPQRTPRARFAAGLLAAAVLLPLALFLVRQDPSALGAQFDTYSREEFYHDALGIRDLRGFLRAYVALMPELSLHGRHFPPGYAVVLYGVSRIFGTGTLPAGATALAGFALGLLLSWRAAARVVGERGGRQAALLVLASPAALDFACTSMDGFFLLPAALAWWLGACAFAPGGRARDALLAGVALLAATCFSFSAFPVGLAILLFALLRGRRALAPTAWRLAGTAAAYAASALLLWAATGFALWDCLREAHAAALALMRRAVGVDPGSLWALFGWGNATAFGVGAGLALVAGTAARLLAWPRGGDPWTPAALLALGAMALGGLYFLEVERVWLFALPWLGAAAVSGPAFSARSLRGLLAAGLAQALAMELLLFTLW